MVFLLPLWSALAFASPVERGVEHAVAIHIPPTGLSSLGAVARQVAPTSFSIEATTDALECSPETTLDYDLEALDILLSTDDVVIDTSDGSVKVTLFATLDSTETTLAASGDCAWFEDLDEVCTLQIPTTAVEVSVEVALHPVAGGVVASAQPISIYISPINNPVSGCTVESAVGTALGLGDNPYLISDLLLDQVEPALADLPVTLEEALEGAFQSLAFETRLDLPVGALDLALEPTRVSVDEAGIVLGLGADIAAFAATDCADAGSVPPPATDWPAFAPVAAGTTLEYDAGALLGRAFIEELLVTLWGSGAFCVELDDIAGVPLQGALAGTFFGDEVTELIGEVAPARLALHSTVPPRVAFWEDQPVVTVDVGDLGMDLMSEVDHRQARLLEVGIDADLGLDVDLVDGVLAPSLIIDAQAFRFTERYSDLLGPGYTANIEGLVEAVLTAVAPQDELTSIAVPQPLGLAVDGIVWKPTPDDAWQGAYVLLDLDGVEPITVGGCSTSSFSCDGSGPGVDFDLGGALGCDDPAAAGCAGEEGACTTVPPGPFAPLIPVLFVVLRRRSR